MGFSAAAKAGRVGQVRRAAIQHALDGLNEAARTMTVAGAPAPPLFGAREDLLVPVLGAADHLARFLVRHPEAAAELAALPPVRGVAAWREALAASVPADADDPTFSRALRVARQRALLGMTARELVTGDPLATGADLAAFAEAALDRALAQARRGADARYGAPISPEGAPCRAVVIGMGKLGGGELNYSSDIDLIFAYDGDGGVTDGAHGLGQVVDVHTYFARVFTRVAELLSEVTDEGFVFRVDLDLRPEGRTGPICNSADGLESYYESFGHAWERLAWLKARPVAGDLALGDKILTALRPFVYRRHHDYGFADEVLAMKRRIDQSGARLGHKDGYNVKLGRGGIREVEFAVQALQLTWGGRLPELRCTDTRTALSRAALAGLMDQAEADHLLGAYRFLRRVEHALQMREDRQTHLLPVEPEARRHVASLLGLDEAQLEATLTEHRKRVRAAFDAVVPNAEPQAPEPAWDTTLSAALEPELGAEQREAALAELGFLRPGATRHRLDAMARRPESPFHWRAATAGLAKKVVRACLASPDPDQALVHFESLFKTLQHRRAALEQLDSDPRRLRVLASLFGSSHALSRLVVRSPGLLDRLVLDGKEPTVRTRAQLRQALEAELTHVPEGDREARLTALRRFKQGETARIGFFDLAGMLDATSVGHQLADLADVIIGALVEGADLGVIAFGALGARELGYGSPLDLVFVAPGDADPAAVARAARQAVAGLTVATPDGALYRLDEEPRPSGHHGPACVSAARLVEHHRQETAPWERLRLLGARVVVDLPAPGGATLGDMVAELRGVALGQAAGDEARVEAAIRELRDRAARGSDAGDLHRQPGGLLDVQLFVQRLQHTLPAAEAAQARAGHAAGSPSTALALAGLAALGRLDKERAQRLVEAYTFVRQLENKLSLVQEQPSESRRLLATEPARWSAAEREHLRRLAMRMGHGDLAGGPDPATELSKEVARHRATLVEETREPGS